MRLSGEGEKGSEGSVVGTEVVSRVLRKAGRPGSKEAPGRGRWEAGAEDQAGPAHVFLPLAREAFGILRGLISTWNSSSFLSSS